MSLWLEGEAAAFTYGFPEDNLSRLTVFSDTDLTVGLPPMFTIRAALGDGGVYEGQSSICRAVGPLDNAPARYECTFIASPCLMLAE